MPVHDRERRDVHTTGRPLVDGQPASGPALELDPDGPSGSFLADSPRALASHPGGNSWATLLERPAEGETERPVLLQWLGPDAPAPARHVHPTSETFEGVEGEVTVITEGEDRRLAPGERAVVEGGQAHTFRNDTDDTVAFRAELPSMRTVRALYTVWGRDHEGAYGSDGAYGRPGFLQGMVLAEELSEETRMTAAPLLVQRVLWATVTPVARAMEYEGIDDAYLAEEFWERHVEQPRLRQGTRNDSL